MSEYRDRPASPEQLVAALMALGAYSGTNDAAERAAEAERLGDTGYRVQLANALLGAAQAEPLLSEQLGATAEELRAAHREQLVLGGVMDPGSEDPNPAKLTAFLRLADTACQRAAARDSPRSRHRPAPAGGRPCRRRTTGAARCDRGWPGPNRRGPGSGPDRHCQSAGLLRGGDEQYRRPYFAPCGCRGPLRQLSSRRAGDTWRGYTAPATRGACCRYPPPIRSRCAEQAMVLDSSTTAQPPCRRHPDAIACNRASRGDHGVMAPQPPEHPCYLGVG